MASAAIFRNTLPPWVYCGDTSCSQSAGSLPVPSGTVPLSSLHIRKPAVLADLLHGFDNIAFPSYSPYHNREASFFLPPYHYLQFCCCFHYCGFIVHTQRCRFSPPKASRFAICRSTFHRFCTVRTFCNVLLNPHFREINAAVFHILNIGNQTVRSCSIQCFNANSQYTGCFLVISLSIAFFAILSAFALSFFLCLFRNVISKLNPYSFVNPTHLPLTYPPKIANHAYFRPYKVSLTRFLRFRVGLVGALWLSLQDYLRFVLIFQCSVQPDWDKKIPRWFPNEAHDCCCALTCFRSHLKQKQPAYHVVHSTQYFCK